MRLYRLHTKYLMHFFIVLLMVSCRKQEQGPNEAMVLAVVENRTITVQDFIHRSEYTIRPSYCNGDTYIHKKIILNTLIGEKLLAMEADRTGELAQNADFHAYIEGRKEQAMRQVHFNEVAYKTAFVSNEAIEREFQIAGRRYQISYLSLPDKEIARLIEEDLRNKSLTLTQVYSKLAGEEQIPKKEIHWKDPENKAIHDLLFNKRPLKNQIIGPIEVDHEKWLFIEVNGWIDQKIMSESGFKERKQLVVEKLKNEKAMEIYDTYVGNLMRNKQINFYKSTFDKLLSIAAPVFLETSANKKQLLNNHFWQESQEKNRQILLPDNLDELSHLPLFSLSGDIWTVDDFRAKLKRHPLVFRDQMINPNNFPEQFKLAIVDMVRDHFITQDAYQKGYDKSFAVVQQVSIWRDNMQAIYQKYKYLEANGVAETDPLKIVTGYITPYLDILQKKYSEKIKINLEEFEELRLTSIDLVALQPQQAFPVVVPLFPWLTVDNKLDYGSSLQESAQ